MIEDKNSLFSVYFAEFFIDAECLRDLCGVHKIKPTSWPRHVVNSTHWGIGTFIVRVHFSWWNSSHVCGSVLFYKMQSKGYRFCFVDLAPHFCEGPARGGGGVKIGIDKSANWWVLGGLMMFRKVTSSSILHTTTVKFPSEQGSLISYMLNTKVLKTRRNRQKVIDLCTAGGRYFGYKTRPDSHLLKQDAQHTQHKNRKLISQSLQNQAALFCFLSKVKTTCKRQFFSLNGR